MNQIKYTGGFTSVAGVKWSFEIWQNSINAITPREIAVGAEPLIIEWGEIDKITPVQSSCATLALFADNDREFIALYSIEVGIIRMDVFRNKALYWSGTLDPELYEEPYSYKANYEVSLTFSDLAILDRLYWSDRKFITLNSLITQCLALSGVNYNNIIEHISTSYSGVASNQLTANTWLHNDNFYDEEGVAMTAREVLEGVLQPFALRLIQKNGSFVLYDLNAVSTLPATNTVWESNDATLGVDKVYNNVDINFSPYEREVLLDDKLDRDSLEVSYSASVRTADGKDTAFVIYYGDEAEGINKDEIGRYFKITPRFSGDESEGVDGYDIAGNANKVIMSATQQVYVNKANSSTRDPKSYLKLTVPILCDTRRNPFEEPTSEAEVDDYNAMKNNAKWAYIYFRATLKNEHGEILYHYNTYPTFNSGAIGEEGTWNAGDGSGVPWATLCYYADDRDKETGLGGWKDNRQTIGRSSNELPPIYKKRGSGEFIPYPPVSGWVDIEIYGGIQIYSSLYTQHEYPYKWLLYKGVKLSVVDYYGNEIEAKGITHSAHINKLAKEAISIDTILGTSSDPLDTAVGLIYNNKRDVVSALTRAGRTDELERLLIGTVYSNYASRHTTLSGTVLLNPDFTVYAENNTAGTFITLGETQNIQSDESEIKIVQFAPDTFKGIEFK